MAAASTANDGTETALSSSSTIQARSNEESQRKSTTVQFAHDSTAPSQSVKSSRRTISSSDETTPIRRTDSNVRRSYNTSDVTLPLPPSQPLATSSAVSQQTESSGTTKVEPGQPWYRRVADKYGSVTLENKASVARDHLALERTFLAWLRTSLSFASIGIAITQLFRLNSTAAKRPTARAVSATYSDTGSSLSLPFSPYIGHAIPPEVLPYLQYIATAATTAPQNVPRPTLGPTLLDQLLLLAPDGTSIEPNTFSTFQSVDSDPANKLRHVGKPLGATFIGISVVVLLVGFQRYFEAQHWIIHGKFPASRGSISLVAFTAFALVIASLIVIIVISPSASET